MEEFKERRLVHKRFAFQIVLEVRPTVNVSVGANATPTAIPVPVGNYFKCTSALPEQGLQRSFAKLAQLQM